MSKVHSPTEARDRALQTPEEVRAAFLGKRHEVAGLTLEPLTIASMLILQELEHPVLRPAEFILGADNKPLPVLDGQGQPKEDEDGNALYQTVPIAMTTRDSIRLIFAFVDTERAFEAMGSGREVYDSEAFAVARQLSMGDAKLVSETIGRIIKEGLATLAGTGNPPEKTRSGRASTTASAGS